MLLSHFLNQFKRGYTFGLVPNQIKEYLYRFGHIVQIWHQTESVTFTWLVPFHTKPLTGQIGNQNSRRLSVECLVLMGTYKTLNPWWLEILSWSVWSTNFQFTISRQSITIRKNVSICAFCVSLDSGRSGEQFFINSQSIYLTWDNF